VRFRRRPRLGAAALVVAVAAACNGLTVNERGVYTSSPTQTITGEVSVASDQTLTSVTVNGVDATIDGDQFGRMRFHGYRAVLRTTDDNATFLELVLDFETGVGLTLVDGGLGFTFDPPAPGDLTATITQNPNNLPAALVDQVFASLTPQVFVSVQDVLPSFPLPQFAGLDLALVDIDRVGSGFVLFSDLVSAV
jgi:hypothetical protein